MIAKKRS